MNKIAPWTILGACLSIVVIAATTACGSGNCTEQSCDKFGGSASRKLQSCYSSGSGSIDDEFELKDEKGNVFYRCTRPADNNDKCGVELITAKEAYCKE